MEKKESEIELNSEEIQTFLGKTPPWILRSGLSMILLIVVLFIIGSALFKYPDTITAPAILTGTTPPARVKAKISGILSDIYIEDNQYVKEGTYLAVIQNSANVRDMIYLKEYLHRFSFNPDSICELPKKNLKLGQLQESYSVFYQLLSEYEVYVKSNYATDKLSIVQKRSKRLESYIEVLEKQKEIIVLQNRINSNIFRRDSILYKEDLLSVEEYEIARKEYLNGFLTLENINSAIQNSKIQIAEIEENFIDSENTFREKDNSYIVNINNWVIQLLTHIRNWEMENVLIAPICGKLSFNNHWAKNQNVVASEEIFHIVPVDSGSLIARIYLPITRSGKVKLNQKVNLHLENFPDNEFGIVRGKISNISKVPSINPDGRYYYTVEVQLTEGLQTSYKKVLPYCPDMSGSADIVTEDMSVLERIFLPIKKILINGFGK